MSPQHLERAPERDLRRCRLVVGARIAVEPVPAGIDVDRHIRPRLPDFFDVGQGNAGVDVAEMQHGWNLRDFIGTSDNLTAIVADCTDETFETRRREECERPAPAIPDHTDFAERPHVIDRRLHIEQARFNRDLRSQRMAGRDPFGAVVELGTFLGAVRQSRHDRCIAQRRKPIGDAANMIVQAEELLQHDELSARRGVRCRAISRELMPIFCRQHDRLFHHTLSRSMMALNTCMIPNSRDRDNE